jgi:hypothetical protein
MTRDQSITSEKRFQGARYRPASVSADNHDNKGVSLPEESNDAFRALRDVVQEHSVWIKPLRQEISRVIVGQKQLIDRLLIALLTNGHVLLEGVPGLAKTLSLKILANSVALNFKRLQFTPDMLPADIVGTMIYSPQDGAFRTKHGPIFSNLILADEINRAPAKVQSAVRPFRPFGEYVSRLPKIPSGGFVMPPSYVCSSILHVYTGFPQRLRPFRARTIGICKRGAAEAARDTLPLCCLHVMLNHLRVSPNRRLGPLLCDAAGPCAGVLEIMLVSDLTHQHTVIRAFPAIGEMTGEIDLSAVSQFVSSQVHRPDAEGLRLSVAILNPLPTVKSDM